jgi:cytochrome c oxidase subunit 2
VAFTAARHGQCASLSQYEPVARAAFTRARTRKGVRVVPFQGQFRQLFSQETTIAAVVFGLVVLVLLSALLLSRWRRKRDKGPSQRAEANRLEIGYLTVLTGIVAYLIVASLTANGKELPDPPKPAVRVQVTSYQWCWRFHYEGNPVTVTGQCQGGSYPTLVLPAGQPVELDLTSVDVIHAFWLPYLRFKMYAYPGHTNTFTTTLTHTGRWLGRCAQLCGLYHYQMDFYVQVVSPAAFRHFLQSGARS